MNYDSIIAEYERTARALASTAADYREKQKEAVSPCKRAEYRDKAMYYERLVKEKLREARILRERKT